LRPKSWLLPGSFNEQRFDGANMVCLDERPSECIVVQQFGHCGQHIQVHSIAAFAHHQQDDQMQLDAGRQVVHAGLATSKHHAKVTVPLDHRVRQGQPFVDDRLCGRLAFFDRLHDVGRQDVFMCPVDRVNQFAYRVLAGRGGQFDNLYRVNEFYGFHAAFLSASSGPSSRSRCSLFTTRGTVGPKHTNSPRIDFND
jgi:hypothetical protein